MTVNYANSDTKTMVLIVNSIIRLYREWGAFIGITKIQVEPQKVVNNFHNSHAVSIPHN